MFRKRRGRGEGGIYYRKTDGLWVGTVDLGFVLDDNLKRKRKRKVVYGKTKTETQLKLRELQSKKDQGLLQAGDDIKVAEYASHWIENVKRPKLGENTIVHYRGFLNNYIKPIIGHYRIDKLTPAHIEAMISEIRNQKESVSEGYIRKIINMLNGVLNHAVKQNRITRNACQAVEKPVSAQSKAEALSVDQVQTLLKFAAGEIDSKGKEIPVDQRHGPHRLYALFLLAISTGMRQGELFGLKWEDIDFEKRCLHVRRNVAEVLGRHVLKEPKTKSGRRRIELTDIDIAALNERRAIAMKEGTIHSEFCFTDSIGGLLRKNNFRRNVWLRLLKQAGLPHTRFHDLRHTSASLMILAGEHPKVISPRLEHSQFAITIDLYSHVMEGQDRQAAENIGRLIKKA